MAKVAITDYFDSPAASEKEILGDLLGARPDEDTEVLMVWHQHINEEYVSQFPNLRAVQRYGVGYDNLDLDYLKSKGIICCNNPDYGVDEVSDTALAFIMVISRGIYRYDQSSILSDDEWQNGVLHDLKRSSDTVIGFIGAGRIGGSTLLKCKAVGFKTAFYDPYKESGYEKMLGSQRTESLEELLKISDVISIHCPLSKETRGMVNEQFLDSMKKGASLVNTARGEIIESTETIFERMESDQLRSVALDVLPEEPPKSDSLINAWKSPPDWIKGRLLINPHTAYFSSASYYEIRKKAAENALRLYKGEKAKNILI